MKLIPLFCKNEQGSGLVEHILIIALIALAAVAAITIVKTKISADFTSIANNL